MQQAFVVVLILAPSVSSLTSPGTPYPGHLPLLLFCPSILFSFKPPLDRYFPGGFPWPPESFEVWASGLTYTAAGAAWLSDPHSIQGLIAHTHTPMQRTATCQGGCFQMLHEPGSGFGEANKAFALILRKI